MSAPIIDLAKSHFTRSRGNLTAIGTWVKIGDRFRPCMAIIRTGDEKSDDAVPCIVTMDRAWIWDETIGDPRATAHVVVAFLEALRLDKFDPKEHVRLVLFIQDNLGDLLAIPPHKGEDGEAIAEVTITERETGKSTEVELNADV